jgi:hypothetical protein
LKEEVEEKKEETP